jgi:hypothetical protein
VEANSDELYDNLLEEIQDSAHKDRYNNFVHSVFPRPDGSIAIDMVIGHGRQKGDLYSQPPKEQSTWKL